MRLIFFGFISFWVISCSISTSNVPDGYEKQHSDSKKIDSVIRGYTTSLYKSDIHDSILNLTISLKQDQVNHFRKRGFLIDRLIFEMSDYLASIRTITVTVTNLNKLLKPVATYTYDSKNINDIKNWDVNDPIYLYFMSLSCSLDEDKYEDLASIAWLFSTEFEDEKHLKTFDPDFAYYIDKFVDEIYGNPKGFRQREIMEAFYKVSSDREFKFIKQTDILPLIEYADSIYYLKEYPSETRKLILNRK